MIISSCALRLATKTTLVLVNEYMNENVWPHADIWTTGRQTYLEEFRRAGKLTADVFDAKITTYDTESYEIRRVDTLLSIGFPFAAGTSTT